MPQMTAVNVLGEFSRVLARVEAGKGDGSFILVTKSYKEWMEVWGDGILLYPRLAVKKDHRVPYEVLSGIDALALVKKEAILLATKLREAGIHREVVQDIFPVGMIGRSDDYLEKLYRLWLLRGGRGVHILKDTWEEPLSGAVLGSVAIERFLVVLAHTLDQFGPSLPWHIRSLLIPQGVPVILSPQ